MTNMWPKSANFSVENVSPKCYDGELLAVNIC